MTRSMKFELEFNKDPRTIDEAVFYTVTWVQLRGKDRRGRYTTRRTVEQENDSSRRYDPRSRRVDNRQKMQPKE